MIFSLPLKIWVENGLKFEFLHHAFKTNKKLENPLFSYENSGFYGPSGEIRTPGVLNPNQVPYQLGHTRIFDCMKWPSEIFPFQLWSNKWSSNYYRIRKWMGEIGIRLVFQRVFVFTL